MVILGSKTNTQTNLKRAAADPGYHGRAGGDPAIWGAPIPSQSKAGVILEDTAPRDVLSSKVCSFSVPPLARTGARCFSGPLKRFLI